MNREIALRRATDADALSAADVWLRSFTAALPSVRCAHDEDDVRDWFTRVLVPKYETWVATHAAPPWWESSCSRARN